MKKLIALAVTALGFMSAGSAFAQGTGGTVATGGGAAGSTSTAITTTVGVVTAGVIGITVESATNDDEATPGTGGTGTSTGTN